MARATGKLYPIKKEGEKKVPLANMKETRYDAWAIVRGNMGKTDLSGEDSVKQESGVGRMRK